VLARANRIVRADDYRNTVRRGRKSATAHCVVYVRSGSAPAGHVRFGFIVAKTVGNAVVRNTVRRRLKAIAHEKLDVLPEGTDVVIRALPGSIDVPWSTLRDEITTVVDKGLRA
jgi:ribonuclease P protein component